MKAAAAIATLALRRRHGSAYCERCLSRQATTAAQSASKEPGTHFLPSPERWRQPPAPPTLVWRGFVFGRAAIYAPSHQPIFSRSTARTSRKPSVDGTQRSAGRSIRWARPIGAGTMAQVAPMRTAAS